MAFYEDRWRIFFEEKWWSFALRGLLAILFGLLCLRTWGLSLPVFARIAGAYLLADGGCALAAVGRRWRRDEPRAWPLFEGLSGVAGGVVLFLLPDMTALALLLLLAAWAAAAGATRIALALQLRNVIERESLLLAGGVVAILLGLFLAIRPGADEPVILVAIVAGSFASGLLLIGAGFRMRGLTGGRAISPLTPA
jgi:uncharacterized membrane protein HdeD (DUF308 family)